MGTQKTTDNVYTAHTSETLSIYWRATIRYRKDVAYASLLLVSAVLMGVVMPFFASKVLAGLISHGGHIWGYFELFIASAALGIAINATAIAHGAQIQARVMHDLHGLMFERLMQRSVGFYANQVGGKLVSDSLAFLGQYGNLVNGGYYSAATFVVTTLIGLTIVIISSWVIGVCILTLFIFLLIWSVQENKRRSHLRSERLRLSRALTSHLSDSIVNAVTVKTFAQEAVELATGQSLSLRLAESRAKDWKRSTTNETYRMGVLLLMQVCLIFVLIKLTAHNPHLLAAGIFAFTFTVTLINRFFTLNTLARQLEEAFLEASPMTQLLQEPIEISDQPDAKELHVKHGAVRYDHVHFGYADAGNGQIIFDDLSLDIKAGERIGLVGKSGGGKSTLTRLLLRFDDIASGHISIDDQDIKNVTQTSLRRQVSYVPQEPLLFHRSIRENIAYGKDGVSQKEIEAAAKSAHAHAFILSLPEGYDTVVGERGVKLSGGQRQRVAIARAMLKNAPILVLDEATSALDSESEKAIQTALWELMKDKTALVIAHRLSTIQKMDRIIVLDEGKIIEQGTHAELIAQHGLYASLWAHQSGGFIEE